MQEIELKAYYYPHEEEKIKKIGNEIEKKTNEKWLQEEIIDTFYDLNTSLKKQDSQLRVRVQGKECFLTYKGKVQKESGYKIREEVETIVDNCESLEQILNKIGMRKTREIQKQRKTIFFQTVKITIDSFTKIGYVMEIEGEKQKIEETIEFLCLPRDKFKPMTYSDVIKIYKNK